MAADDEGGGNATVHEVLQFMLDRTMVVDRGSAITHDLIQFAASVFHPLADTNKQDATPYQQCVIHVSAKCVAALTEHVQTLLQSESDGSERVVYAKMRPWMRLITEVYACVRQCCTDMDAINIMNHVRDKMTLNVGVVAKLEYYSDVWQALQLPLLRDLTHYLTTGATELQLSDATFIDSVTVGAI